MSAAVPEVLAPLVADFSEGLQQELPGQVTGLYLLGSIALDAFQPGHSDVDFMVVLGRLLADADIERLAQLHRALAQRNPRFPLQGSYLQIDQLGQAQPVPHYTDGRLEAASLNDLNPVTWWLFQHRAVTVFGPPAATLPLSVDWESVAEYTRHNMQTYWRRYLYQPGRVIHLWNDWGVQWVTLGVLRQAAALETGDIVSKRGAGEWGLAALPARWHRLIREALRIREGGPPQYANRLQRALDVWQFLRTVLNQQESTLHKAKG